MADDLDKFVLQYTVDLRDSVARLEKLHDKMDGVKSKSKGAGDGMKEFATGAMGELNKLVPGVNAVTEAVGALGAEFAAAAAAVGILAVGVKSVVELRTQFNAQRQQGMTLGMSPIRLEDDVRKLIRTGGGYVSRDSATSGMESLYKFYQAAYADPNPLNKNAQVLSRFFGVNARQNLTGGQLFAEIGGHLSNMSEAQVRGLAQANGFDPNLLMSIRAQGAAGMANITDTSSTEIENRQNAQKALDKFNDELERFKQNINDLEMSLGEKLLPAADKFLEWVDKLVGAFNHAVSATPANDPSHKYIVGPGRRLIPNPNYVDPNGPAPTYNQGRYKIENGHRVNLPDIVPAAEQKKETDAEVAKKAAAAASEQQKRNGLVSADETADQNPQSIQSANQFMLAANLFAQAVGAFSNTIDLQKAWAAWAGQAGAAANLPGSSSAAGVAGTPGALAGGGSGSWQKSQYAAAFKAAAAATGMDPQMLYAVMMTESHGVNGQYSSAGAGGLMQVTRGNWKKLGGGADVMDPATNIMVGAKILKEQVGIHHGDMVAALGGYNGHSDPEYAAKVAKNYGGTLIGAGQSRGTMNLQFAQQALATAMGVPLGQIQNGGVRAADLGVVYAHQMISDQMGIQSLQQQLSQMPAGMNPAKRGELQTQMRKLQQQYDALKQYGTGIISAQQAGPQEKTAWATGPNGPMGGNNPVININIQGITDPKVVAAEVNKQLAVGMNTVLNHFSSSVKG